jgi:hypothetical protein
VLAAAEAEELRAEQCLQLLEAQAVVVTVALELPLTLRQTQPQEAQTQVLVVAVRAGVRQSLALRAALV